MPNRKYFLDLSDLQFKRVRVARKHKLLQALVFFVVSVTLSVIYGKIYTAYFGSPKEKILSQEVENLKLDYALMGRKLDNSLMILRDLELSDASRYRPVLDMDSIPFSLRNPGYGGVNRYEDIEGYMNTELMMTFRRKVQDIRNKTSVQFESFKAIEERKNEWKREMEYLPMICPVNVNFRRGDGLKFREVHPVLGTPQWHHGQDFSTPYGTEVYATGSGTVIDAGWNSGGFGNCIVIDHGYGYRSTYGHLSGINVSVGQVVKRGEMIGLTGSSGTSSGPHLHYQIDLFGQHKNPLHYFNDDLSEDEYFEMIETLSARTIFR